MNLLLSIIPYFRIWTCDSFLYQYAELATRHLQTHFLLHRNIRRGCPISPNWNGVENPENMRGTSSLCPKFHFWRNEIDLR